MKMQFYFTFLLLIFKTFEVSAQEPTAFNQRVQDSIEAPYIGITVNGSPRVGLYKIEKTGIPTEPVVAAASELISLLSETQQEQITFPIDDSEWRNWANVHRFQRQGVSLDEMSKEQREKAYSLLRVSLSVKGYRTSRDIMRLNHHLGELVGNFSEYGEHLYWITIMGEPSTEEPWGWQIDGHHLINNYFMLGDQIVMTPTFMGSEPVKAESGQYQGTLVLEVEQDRGLEFMQSLPKDKQRTAMIGMKQGRSENLTEMAQDNAIVPIEGVAARQLSEAHREKLMDLIALYVGNLRDGHAQIKLDKARHHLDDTYFAWKGGIDERAIFYYRIQSPILLIEFDHQGPIALEGERQTSTRNHIHTVVRTPNGNDYGKSLLKQHLQVFRDDPNHGHVAFN